jgi:hypothetical protein
MAFRPTTRPLPGKNFLEPKLTGSHRRTYETIFRHPDVARHIVGSLAVDEQHLTENQLLARAREFDDSANSMSVK